MKKISGLLLVASLVSALAMPALAQTPPPPPLPGEVNTNPQFGPVTAPVATFFESVQSYFGSFDTNSTTFVGNKFDLWTGADYVSGVNLSSSLGLEYNLKGAFSVESVTRNAGIAGTIVSTQAGVGVSKVLYDTKFTAFIDGGYDFNLSKPYCAIGARVKKALTTHTFAGISLETQIGGKRPSTPIVGVFTGFTF